MIRKREGTVLSVEDRRTGITEITVLVEHKKARALNYDAITGPVLPGDRVVLNTTAVFLGLGTGGYHFVCFNYKHSGGEASTAGHIMKMRYTPYQVKVCCYEEDSGFREQIENFGDLDGKPVIIGELHSMIAPAALAIKSIAPDIRTGFLMTDSAALPIYLSRIIHELKEMKIIDTTVTCGQAFGGDLEAVNVYSGLIAAFRIARVDILLVGAGPGVVGTGTRYGFSGMEVGENVNRVSSLGGVPVVIPRISFADKRARHRGISHHTLTALSIRPIAPAYIPLPPMAEEASELVNSQLTGYGLWERHRVCTVTHPEPTGPVRDSFLNLKTMGRGQKEDPYFFYAAMGAGKLACFMERGRRGWSENIRVDAHAPTERGHYKGDENGLT